MRIVTMCIAHGVALEGEPMLVRPPATSELKDNDKSSWDVDLSHMDCPTARQNDLFWCNITWAVCVVQ